MKLYDRVSLGILAGGQALRLQGADKAFLKYENEYLAQRILNKLNVDFADRFISSREVDIRFADMGLKAVLDKREAFSGPLAGIEALLEITESEFLLTIPVDIKFVPTDLLISWINKPETPGMVLQDQNGLQPLLALWHVEGAKIAVKEALKNNEKSVKSIITELKLNIIHRTDFQIGNLNTPQDFETP